MEKHYLLGETAKLVGRKPHQIVHLLTTGKIPEPEQRISNKRLFTSNDVIRLARHFKVAPNWAAIETADTAAEAKATKGLTLRPPFEVISEGETGSQVRDGDGEIFAWAPDRGRGLLLAGLLETVARG
jgi:hypothetical protein